MEDTKQGYNHTEFERPPLTLFIPSNSEWVASPSQSNIGAKRSKAGVGQEKPD